MVKQYLLTGIKSWLVLFCFAYVLIRIFLFYSIAITIGFHKFVLLQDYRAFATAGQMLLHHTIHNFYDMPTQFFWQHHIVPEFTKLYFLNPFRNPPFVALLYIIPSLFPIEIGYAICVIAECLLLLLIIKILITNFWQKSLFANLLLVGLTISFWPILTTIVLTQTSLLLVLALLGAFLLLKKEQFFKAGLLFSLLLIKPQYLLLPIIMMLWQKNWTAFKGMVIGVLILLFISTLLISPDGIVQYIHFLTTTFDLHDRYSLHPDTMYTMRGLLQQLMHEDAVTSSRVWLITEMGLLVLFFLSIQKRVSYQSQLFYLQYSALCIATILISPYANLHDVSIVIISAVLLYEYATKKFLAKKRLVIFILLLVGYLIGDNQVAMVVYLTIMLIYLTIEITMAKKL